MTDGYYSFNSQTYPVPSTSVDATPILQLADPVIYKLASLITQLLNKDLLPRFQEEAIACGLTHANIDNWVDGVAVAQTVVFPFTSNPTLLKTTDFKFPLLSIYPESEEFHMLTLTTLATKREIVVTWILPPLTPGQYNKMYPFFSVATKTILAYASQGYDPKIGTSSFWKQAGLSFGEIYDVIYEPLEGLHKTPNTKDMVQAMFPCIELRMATFERNKAPVPQNYPTNLSKIELQINLVDGYNPASPVVDFADGYIVPDISITSVSPNTGTIHGNTLVYVHGTGFAAEKIKNASQLTFCDSPAKQVTVLTPSLMLALTNPNAAGIGDVVFTDLQSNTYKLTNGFTYI